MGFYGNLANVARTTFSFDKTYSTHFEMVLKEASDQVFVGRYALLDYDYRDEKDDGVYKLVQIVEWLRTNHLGADWEIVKKSGDIWEEIAFNPDTSATQNKSITLVNGNYYIVVDGEGSFESPLLYRCDGDTKTQIKFGDGEGEASLPKSISNWYKSHYQIDEKIFNSVGRGWDSTVWQKTYKGDNLAYIMIAELNGVVPTIDILNDPPVWLSGIEIPDENTNPDEYNKYDYRVHHMAPYFDKEDRTNLHYNLHVQSPWKFGIGEITGLPENKGDKISLNYTKSEKDDYSYGVGKTGTAVDTIKFDFALPSIGNALSNIKDLLYGKDYYQGELRDQPYWEENINPVNQGKTIKVNENTKIFYNGITYYPDLNPGAFTSVAGALNTLYTALGSNITNSYITKEDGLNYFPEGYIYYASYNELTEENDLKDVNSDYVSTEGIDTDSEGWKNKKYYWYQYNDIDNYDPKKKYRILEGYPSYNKVLLALGQQTADALDLVSNLQNLANEKVGSPGSLMFTDSDYRTGGATLVGDDAIIVNEPTYSTQRNYLPYPNWFMTGDNGGKIYGQIKEKGLTFTITDKKTFTIQGTATANTEEIIATNVYLPQGTYSFTGVPKEAANISCYLMAIKDDVDTENDVKISGGGKAEINITSDDFYFDVVKICVDEGASFDVAVEFTPMIKLATDTNTKYVPYQNEYEINIKHRQAEGPIDNPEYVNKDDENGNSIIELANKYTVYAPTVDAYGHVTKMSKESLPNYYSKILLKDSNTEDQKIYLAASSVGDELDLTQIQGMSFEKSDDRIIFKPVLRIGDETVKTNPIYSGTDSDMAEWRTLSTLTGFKYDLNDNLILDYKAVPFPINAISVNSRPNQVYKVESVDEEGNLVTNYELKPIEFDWTDNTEGSLVRTGIHFPELKHIPTPANNGVGEPGRMISFAPADDNIKIGLLKDNATNAAQDAGTILIGHTSSSLLGPKVTNSDNKDAPYLVKGEINKLIKANLLPSQTGLDIWSAKNLVEKVYFNSDAAEAAGTFNTVSIKTDKTGHIVDIQEIKIKLMIETALNNWWYTNFRGFVPISPWVGPSFGPEVGMPAGFAQYGLGSIGEYLPLMRLEKDKTTSEEIWQKYYIRDYAMIATRVGVDSVAPGGGGGPNIHYHQTANILGKLSISQDQKTIYSNWLMPLFWQQGPNLVQITIRWEKNIEQNWEKTIISEILSTRKEDRDWSPLDEIAEKGMGTESFRIIANSDYYPGIRVENNDPNIRYPSDPVIWMQQMAFVNDEDKLKTTGKRVLKSAIDTWAGHTIDWQKNPVSSVTTPYFSDYRAGAEYNTVSGRPQMRSRAHDPISGFRAVYAIGPKRPPENYAWSYSVSIDEEETSDEGYDPDGSGSGE